VDNYRLHLSGISTGTLGKILLYGRPVFLIETYAPKLYENNKKYMQMNLINSGRISDSGIIHLNSF
jgi:hypothetical protein